MAVERLKERILAIQARIPAVRGRGEEATKQALVLPMLDALGFDIWNPAEVCPEFEADFAIKKQGQKEKVDLAIVVGDAPRIFFEVKPVDQSLDGHQGQLARYFNGITTVSLGILTNGVEYWFYTDTGEPNLLDPTPFFVFRLDSLDLSIDVLTRFHRDNFSPGAIRDFATELNYTTKITQFLRNELDLRSRDASETLVRWVLAADEVYDGRVVASVVERFRPIVKNALQLVLRDIVRRSVAALDEGVTAPEAKVPGPEPTSQEPAPNGKDARPEPVPTNSPEDASARVPITTGPELAAYQIVKAQFETSSLASGKIFDASMRKEVPIELGFKDTTGYFGIYFNKPGWWFARLQLDSKQPWVALNVDPTAIASLLPSGFALLPPSAHGDVRVGIRGADDLHALNRALIAAMLRTVEERKPKIGDPG